MKTEDGYDLCPHGYIVGECNECLEKENDEKKPIEQEPSPGRSRIPDHSNDGG